MRGRAILVLATVAAALAAAAPLAQAQGTFKVPFKFESGGKKLPPGDYLVTRADDGHVSFREVSSGKDVLLPVTEKLAPPEAGVAPSPAMRLVFDEVGTFEPSYTEYFTVYVLAEVWLSEHDGYLVHRTKGAHKNRVVNGEPAKK